MSDMSDASHTVVGDLGGFTPGTVQVVAAAEIEARALGHDRVGTEHLLLALLRYEGGLASMVLADAGMTEAPVRRKVREAVGAGAAASHVQQWTARAVRAVGRAPRFARDAGVDLVHSEHLLLAVLDVEGTAGQVLRGLGVDVDHLAASLRTARAGLRQAEEPPVAAEPAPSQTDQRALLCPGCGADLRSGVTATEVPVLGHDVQALLLGCPECATVLGVSG
jgi:ATP-dependent Clp protease ATP-binding subunit ClpA